MEQVEYEEEPFVPHEVAELVIRQNMPLVKAWRLYKGLTVEEVAKASDLRTYEIDQIESSDNNLSFQLEKIANGLNLYVDQLVDV